MACVAELIFGWKIFYQEPMEEGLKCKSGTADTVLVQQFASAP